MSKSCFFSKRISELDTRIRGYAVRKSSFSKCISELDIRIHSEEITSVSKFISEWIHRYEDTQ